MDAGILERLVKLEQRVADVERKRASPLPEAIGSEVIASAADYTMRLEIDAGAFVKVLDGFRVEIQDVVRNGLKQLENSGELTAILARAYKIDAHQ